MCLFYLERHQFRKCKSIAIETEYKYKTNVHVLSFFIFYVLYGAVK